MIVYLLSHYDEHGSEGVVGTVDRGAVLGLLKSFQGGRYYDEAKGKLAEVLADESLLESRDPINLLSGWGGVQLHIVPLSP